MLPGLWQILFSLGVFASCRLLPRATFGVAVFYLVAGLATPGPGPGRLGVLPLGDGPAVRRAASSSRPASSTGPWSAAMTNSRKAAAPGDDASGRFAYDGLERVFHEKARLGIMTSLVGHPKGLIFSDLKELCALTDGNLSRHLQVLHEAGPGRGLEGVPPEPPPDRLPDHRRGQAPVPRIHQRPRKRRRRRPPRRQARRPAAGPRSPKAGRPPEPAGSPTRPDASSASYDFHGPRLCHAKFTPASRRRS